MASEQFVVFQLAKEEYGIPIGQVKEIIRYNGATQLPNALGYMSGIINLRGKIISIIDLAGKFAMVDNKCSTRQALIVEASGNEVGLLVDSVTEVIRLDDSAIETANGIAHSNAFIKAIGKVNNSLIIILNLAELFTQAEMTALKNAG